MKTKDLIKALNAEFLPREYFSSGDEYYHRSVCKCHDHYMQFENEKKPNVVKYN